MFAIFGILELIEARNIKLPEAHVQNDECGVGYCVSCVSGNSTMCVACEEGYETLDGGVSCTEVTCGVENCKTCVSGNSAKCDVCEDGYEVDSEGLCLQSGSGSSCDDRHCASCVESSSKCDSCSEGWELSEDYHCVVHFNDNGEAVTSTEDGLSADVSNGAVLTLGDREVNDNGEMNVERIVVEETGTVKGGDGVSVSISDVVMTGGTLTAGNEGSLSFESSVSLSGDCKVDAGDGELTFSSVAELTFTSLNNKLPEINLGSGTGGEVPNKVVISGVVSEQVDEVIVRGSGEWECESWSSKVEFTDTSLKLSSECRVASEVGHLSESVTELVIVEVEDGEESSGLSSGAIAGIIVGCVVVVVVVVVLIVYFAVNKKNQKEPHKPLEDL